MSKDSASSKPLLILMRHGESVWNALNLFSGWVDVPLSEKGIAEACKAGREINHIDIDMVYVSLLSRATMTALLAMSNHGSGKTPIFQHAGLMGTWGQIHNPEALKNTIPIIAAQELNERMYGQLQGLNKAETIAKFGADQVQIWRRSYDVAPPGGESLEMTAARTLPYFNGEIAPRLAQGKTILIVAHGNSLRSIMMKLEGLSQTEVVSLEIPTGVPLIYTYENGKFLRLQEKQ